MTPLIARHDPQRFIDYIAASNQIAWHFKNDPFWSYDVKVAEGWGWCGAIQSNFYTSLVHEFPALSQERDIRKLTFYVEDGGCHAVTCYDRLIIDTMFNICVYRGKRFVLCDDPVKHPPEHLIDYYYKTSCTTMTFSQQVTIKRSTSRGKFPSLLEAGQ